MRRTFYLFLLLRRLWRRRRSTPSRLPSFLPSFHTACSSLSLSLSFDRKGRRCSAVRVRYSARQYSRRHCLCRWWAAVERPCSCAGRPAASPPARSFCRSAHGQLVRVLRRRCRMEAAQTEAKVLPLSVAERERPRPSYVASFLLFLFLIIS